MDYEKYPSGATEVVADLSLSTEDSTFAPKKFIPRIISDGAEKSPLIHLPRLKKKVSFCFLESSDGSRIEKLCSSSNLHSKEDHVNPDCGFHPELGCGNSETAANPSESFIPGAFSQMSLQSDLSDESKYLDIDMNFEGAKKKKRKSIKHSKQDATETYTSNASDLDKELFIVENLFGAREYDYSYDQLLTRFYHVAKQKRPSLEKAFSVKVTVKPPQVFRVGSKRTSFANIIDICRFLHRAPHHLMSFVLTELGTSGSLDGNNQLIIKGRFQQKQIECVIRRYIKEYVKCLTCNSTNTALQKEVRLNFLMCENCESRRSVPSIKSGFQAVTDKRAAMRAKAVH